MTLLKNCKNGVPLKNIFAKTANIPHIITNETAIAAITALFSAFVFSFLATTFFSASTAFTTSLVLTVFGFASTVFFTGAFLTAFFVSFTSSTALAFLTTSLTFSVVFLAGAFFVVFLLEVFTTFSYFTRHPSTFYYII